MIKIPWAFRKCSTFFVASLSKFHWAPAFLSNRAVNLSGFLTDADMQDSKKGHQGGAVDESLDRTNTETPAAQPNLPKRGQRGRGKSGKR